MSVLDVLQWMTDVCYDSPTFFRCAWICNTRFVHVQLLSKLLFVKFLDISAGNVLEIYSGTLFLPTSLQHLLCSLSENV